MGIGSKSFGWTVGVLALAGALGAGWTWSESKPRPLVDGSAYAYYKANVAPREPGKVVLTRPHTGALWADLTSAQQSILKPLEARWDHLTKYQRRALLHTADRYPHLNQEQQRRYTARLVDWTKLTRKERMTVRQTYKQLASLPPEKQVAVGKFWMAEHGQAEEGQLTHTSTEPPPAEE